MRYAVSFHDFNTEIRFQRGEYSFIVRDNHHVTESPHDCIEPFGEGLRVSGVEPGSRLVEDE